MTDRPTDVLISTYLDTREWKTRREPVDKTSTIIRVLVSIVIFCITGMSNSIANPSRKWFF